MAGIDIPSDLEIVLVAMAGLDNLTEPNPSLFISSIVNSVQKRCPEQIDVFRLSTSIHT